VLISKSLNIFCGRLSEKLVRLSQKWLDVFVLSYTFGELVTPDTRSKYIIHMNNDTVLICDAGGVGAGQGGQR
jgi:hypothetical protein